MPPSDEMSPLFPVCILVFVISSILVFVTKMRTISDLTSTDDWALWSPWSQCNNARHANVCSRSRDRTCASCGPNGQGGIQQAIEKCNIAPCILLEAQEDPLRNDYRPQGPDINVVNPGPVSQWGPWSGCASNCLPGTLESRSLTCPASGSQNYGQCPTGGETRPCNCVQQGVWGNWGYFGPCSASCGQGVQTRSRTCTVPGQCQGQSTEQQSCTSGSCCQWSQWSGCSVTCGSGFESRSQNCGNGGSGFGQYGNPGTGGGQSESRPCSLGPCSNWNNWGPWGGCSVTCGNGVKSRSRVCTGGNCQGPSTSETSCFERQCAQWNNWNSWTQCSLTCGTGVQSRTRSCNGAGCPGPASESQTCNYGSCPTWGTWSEWSECPVTCRSRSDTSSRPTENRYRTCSGASCPGASSQERGCIPAVPVCAEWTDWGAWSSCTATCTSPYGGSVVTRTRRCRAGRGDCIGDSTQTQPCGDNLQPCATWGQWGPWEQCSITCTPTYGQRGSQVRSRECIGAGDCQGTAVDSRLCDPQPPVCAYWGNWSPWTPCPVTCVSNVQQPGGYGNQGFGSTSNFVGQQTRNRFCNGGSCDGLSVESRDCVPFPPPCAEWSQWGPWSSCPRTCIDSGGNQYGGAPIGGGDIGGTRVRTRSCSSGVGCIGSAQETEICGNLPPCPVSQWAQWGAWAGCTATCGSGFETRSRSCSSGFGCPGAPQETRPCPLPPCTAGPSGGYNQNYPQFFAG